MATEIKTTKVSHPVITQIKQAAAGGISGFIMRFTTQPFDVLKIRFQMQVEPVSKKHKQTSKYTGVFQALNLIYKEEGMAGVFKGHTAGQFMSISYALAQFWSYEQFRLAAHQTKALHDHSLLTYFLCGGSAGCVGVIISQPFDVVRTRNIASDTGSKSSGLGPITALLQIRRKEGIRALYRGMSFTLFQVYPLVGSNFLFYKIMNQISSVIIQRLKHPDHYEKHIPTPMLFVNGFVAGVLSKAIVYPLDLLKKRVQLGGFQEDRKTYGENPKCPSLFKCIEYTYKYEGAMGFFKGMIPTLIKSGISSAVYFACYDFIISIIFHRRFLHNSDTDTKTVNYESL